MKILKMLALARKQALMLGSLLEDAEAEPGTPGARSEPKDLPEHFREEIDDLWQQYDVTSQATCSCL